MFFRYSIPILLLLGIGAVSRQTGAPPKLKLSEYGFFSGNLSDLNPGIGVFPYEVNAPLFSDYAEKARFVYLPAGQAMTYRENAAFDFPAGAVLLKNFFYYHDAGHPEKGRRILETRLLVRDDKGWKALEYIWNAAQTDATLEVAGASFPVAWTDAAGDKHQIEYIAPNLNQCKGCHSYDGQFVPLGLSIWQLNRGNGPDNQLIMWGNEGRLILPENFDPGLAPRLADYRLPNDAGLPATRFPDALTARARAYLDGNCGHCHNPHGPANTSGMFLDIRETDPERIGIGKPPVAAGRGSGNRRFGIVPGKPQESILLFRMQQDDPGIRMPELGRQLEHKEGVHLIKTWIKNLNG